jgi:mono/diheme cytochrome c family protein
MRARLRGAVVPVACGLVAAAVAFAVVLGVTRDEVRPAAVRTEAAAAPAAGDVERGRAVFAAMGCGGCHRLAAAGSQGQIGPPLDQALPNHTRESLRAKITDPGGSSIMPGDFARRLSARDLDALIDFLLAARGSAR